ncbi:hypothetical protein [Actinoplanes sp. TFC3]|uniref:hypothetical protein n=1 Tax=Actinoplanes sp. TFC3 TaxID=1710355 RepID=UPI0008342B6B|nr:hypothetical protein [Actinoplanes sp. TFC3]
MTELLPNPATAISYDIVGSSAGGYTRHNELLSATENAVTAIIEASPYPGQWVRSNRGDGEVTVALSGIPGAWILARFLPELHAALVGYNANKSVEHRLLLRVGVAFGDVLVDNGMPRGGDALVMAARLRDDNAAYEAFDAVPAAQVVAMISDAAYERAVPHHAMGLESRRFRRVRTRIEGRPATGWLHVPHHEPPVVTGAEPNAPAAQKPAPEPAKAEPVKKKPAKKKPSEGAKYHTEIEGGTNAVGDRPTAVSWGSEPS